MNFLPARIFLRLVFVVLAGASVTVTAQQGHPLDGSWSGERVVGGDDVRILLTMKLLPDQSFEAMVIERGARLPVHDITVDPADWSVSLTVDGQTRNGETVQYSVDGVIENLGSVNDRWIAGTWRSGAEAGEFRVKMN